MSSVNDKKQQLFKARAENKNKVALKQLTELVQSSLKTKKQPSKNIRVLIDMQAVQGLSRFRGLGRFAISFAKAMRATKGSNDVHLLFNSRLESEFADQFIPLFGESNIHLFDPGAPTSGVNPNHLHNWPLAKAAYQAKVASIGPDILHNPSFFEGYGDDCISDIAEHPNGWKVVVTLHDLIPLELQKEYLNDYPAYKEYYLKCIEEFKQAKQLVSISEHSRQQAINLLNFPPESVTNCSSAADDDFLNTPTTNSDTVLQKHGIYKKYILYTGGDDVRKNLPRLIEAYCTLPRQVRNEYQLVLVGPSDKGNASLLFGLYRPYVEKTEVRILNFVNNEELAALYENASLFAFPSYSEGFGLPLLEAMHFEVPIICSDCSVIPEVVEHDECYFDPFSVDSIRSKMLEILTSRDAQQRIIEHGKKQIQKYSWEITAAKTWDVYNDIIDVVADGKKQLLVDVSELVQRDAKSGIQRVTRAILKQLLDLPPSGYVVRPVYADVVSYGYKYADQFMSKLENKTDAAFDRLITFGEGDVFLGLDLCQSVTSFQKPYLDQLSKAGVKICFFAHDIIPITHGNFFSGDPEGPKKAHEEWLKVATSYDGVVCVSKFTADEIRKWCKSTDTNINVPLHVSWNGYDIKNSMPTKGVTPKQRVIMDKCFDRQTFIVVGTIEPRKGHLSVINAMIKHRANIMIVGKQGWMAEDIVNSIRSNSLFDKRLFWINDATDECLEECYTRAKGVIVPSYVEGFGLPVVEAAQHNKPLILRDIPVFRELAQDSAMYFSSDDELGDLIAQSCNVDNIMPSAVPLITWEQSTKTLLDFII